MKKFLALMMLFLLAGLAGLGWAFFVYPQEPVSLPQPVEVAIARGSGGVVIAGKLADAGVIEHPQLFRILSQLFGVAGSFQAGEYLFQGEVTPAAVMEKLRSGDIIIRKITVPEGKTSVEVIELINRAMELVGDIAAIPAEGSLLPNTYRYVRDDTRQSLVDRMQQEQRKLLDAIWDQRAADLPFTTPQQALALASIVEKETGVPEERRHVAGLYINRLKKGMLLQADPTVAYGVYGGQYADKPLRVSDLKKDTPYNTYLHTGLPPTPICNPGKEAIEAVLNPLQHDDLYMVAKGDGGHYFAKTNQEHLHNVARYRAWKRAQQ